LQLVIKMFLTLDNGRYYIFLHDKEAKQAVVFVPGKPFLPSLIFASKAPNLKGLPGTNALAYFVQALAVKRF
jgi:hypothetical protein